MAMKKYKQKVKDVLYNEHLSRKDCIRELFGDEK